jgi:L-2-hydroxyglutarate oxidase
MFRFCEQHGIAHERCGKLVVATRESELPALEELERRGRANGLQGLRRLGPEGLRDYEPHASGIAGLFVAETGIVDYAQVTLAIAGIVERAGGQIWTRARVFGFHRGAAELVLETGRGDVRCRLLVNCGGLQADRIARMCGVEPGLRIIPFRGEYYTLNPKRSFLVRNLIYPVPDAGLPFLGVHFTRMIHGGVEAGPNAVLALKREGYSRLSFSPADTQEMALYAGFWRMAWRYRQAGIMELSRSLSKRAFVKALRRLVPEVMPDDVHRAGAGVRAQAVGPGGHLLDDFQIVEAERMIHVLNTPSPAATASISIGWTIAQLAEKWLAMR